MLQGFAIRVLSQTTCASSCERNWSAQKYVQGSGGNILPGTLDDRVFIFANLRLERKLAEPISFMQTGKWDDPDQSDEDEDEDGDEIENGAE